MTSNGETAVLCCSCLKGTSSTVVYNDVVQGMTTIPKKLQECPVCGTKRGDIHKTSLVGCPLCYVVFEETVRPMAAPH